MTELKEQAKTIAATLGESEPAPLAQIERALQVLGPDRVQLLVEETLQIEANGGMLTANGKQRRTPGGVFFKLVKEKSTTEERRAIFPHLQRSKRGKTQSPAPPPAEEIHQAITEAIKQQGEASTVKLTMIGRPGRIVEKSTVVITSMQNTKAPSLPKGLPQPPADPTTYVVYIAMKQWRKVKDALNKQPDDKLIIEGYPVFDKRLGQSGTMTIYAQSVTTKLIQQARRKAEKEAAG